MTHSKRWVLVVVANALFAASAGAETFLVQQGEDSAPYAFLPDLPRGDRNSAYAYTNSLNGFDHSFEFYMWFDLPPELTQPGTVVEEAYAWVYYGFDYTIFADTTDEVGEIRCHEVLEGWSEDTLTWNNRPPIGPVFDGWVDITEFGMYWCDVTAQVQAWIDGEPNRGIALTSVEPRVIGFYTFEDGTVSPNFRPSLVVETVPEPGVWIGAGVGAVAIGWLAQRRRRKALELGTPPVYRSSSR